MSKINIIEINGSERLIAIPDALENSLRSLKISKDDLVIITIDKRTVNKFPELIKDINIFIDDNKTRLCDDNDDIKVIISTLNDENYILSENKSKGIYSNMQCIIRHAPKLNMYDLDQAITLEDPEYLLMSIGTLSLIKNTSMLLEKRTRDMNHSYHAYCNIPIALTEVLDPGIIEIVKRVETKR